MIKVPSEMIIGKEVFKEIEAVKVFFIQNTASIPYDIYLFG